MKSFLMCLVAAGCFAIPGRVIMKEVCTGIPVVEMKSLDLKRKPRFNRIEKGMDPVMKRRLAEISRRREYYDCDEYVVVRVARNLNRSKFMEALRSGFFDKIAKIEGLVVDQNNACRGYIVPKMSWGEFRGEMCRDFCERMKEREEETGFTLSCGAENIGVIDGKFYLLDVLGVGQL